MRDSAEAGILLFNAFNSEVKNNLVRDSGINGIELDIGAGNHVAGNRVFDSEGAGIIAVGFPSQPSEDHRIVDNFVRNSDGDDGIELTDTTTDNVVIGNEFRRNDEDQIDDDGTNNTVVGNVV